MGAEGFIMMFDENNVLNYNVAFDKFNASSTKLPILDEPVKKTC